VLVHQKHAPRKNRDGFIHKCNSISAGAQQKVVPGCQEFPAASSKLKQQKTVVQLVLILLLEIPCCLLLINLIFFGWKKS
jgi:hypothetical protein